MAFKESSFRARETTPLLNQSQDDSRNASPSNTYRGFLDTGEQERREVLAKKTVFGEVRNLKRLGWVEWVFLVIATVTMLGLLGLSIERFVSIRNSFHNFTDDDSSGYMSDRDPIEHLSEGVGMFGWAVVDDDTAGGEANTTRSDCNEWTCLNDFVFALVLLVNLGFCTFYCYDGILRERPFEILGYGIGMFVIMLYVIINYSLEGNQGDTTSLVRLVLVIVVCPENVVLAFVVQYRMGYLVLHTIGSNQSLTRAYHVRSLFITVQRFNLQIMANIYVLSWAKNGHFTSLSEKIALPLLIVYLVVVAYIGWMAVTWELRNASIVWFFLTIPSLGYYVYKMINIAVHWTEYEKTYTEFYINGNPPDEAHFIIDATIILVLCVLGLLCVVGTFAFMLVSMKNFGKGLKDKLPPPCSKCAERQTG